MSTKPKVFKAVRTVGGVTQETAFTETAWNLLGKNKDGWEIVKTLPADLQKEADDSEAKALAKQQEDEAKQLEASITQRVRSEVEAEFQAKLDAAEQAKAEAEENLKKVKAEQAKAKKDAKADAEVKPAKTDEAGSGENPPQS